jgi:hypothetical protein
MSFEKFIGGVEKLQEWETPLNEKGRREDIKRLDEIVTHLYNEQALQNARNLSEGEVKTKMIEKIKYVFSIFMVIRASYAVLFPAVNIWLGTHPSCEDSSLEMLLFQLGVAEAAILPVWAVYFYFMWKSKMSSMYIVQQQRRCAKEFVSSVFITVDIAIIVFLGLALFSPASSVCYGTNSYWWAASELAIHIVVASELATPLSIL